MGWDRKGNGSYYTRSKFVNDKVTREYIGTGQQGEEAAAEDARRREERQGQAEAVKQEKQYRADLTARLDELCHLTDLLKKSTLLNAGFHQHDQGAWRRRRHANHQTD